MKGILTRGESFAKFASHRLRVIATVAILCAMPVATRATLVANVWGYADDGGSNVVDVVVRSLRKKLSTRASAIETVTGAGYRFRKSSR